MHQKLDSNVRVGIRLALITLVLIGIATGYNLSLLLDAADISELISPESNGSEKNINWFLERNEVIDLTAKTTTIIIIGLCVVAIGLLFVASRIIRKYIQQRDLAEQALVQENEQLESRVKERTADLQREIAEKEKAYQAVRAAEEALAIKEERLRLTLESGGMSTWEWNLQTGEMIWDEDYGLLYGLESLRFEDGYEPFLVNAHPEDMPHLVTHLVEAKENLKPIQYEYRIWRGQSLHWISIRGQVQQEAGQSPRILGIVTDITDRKRSEQLRKELLSQLHALNGHLQQVREDERTRIAREIHDELGQSLTGLKMEVAWCKNKLQRAGETFSTKIMLDKTESMFGLIDETIRTVRRIASELRPGVLDELGLAAAIEWLSREFELHSHIHCAVEVEDVQLPREAATAMFRICQEALTNVGRHSQASEVRITLKRVGDELQLQVKDNGRGIRPGEEQKKSLGLLGMRERAALVRGKITIDGSPGQGTTVTMRLSLQARGLP